MAILSNLRHDLYLVLAAFDLEGRSATFKAYLNPLINWIWIGCLVLMLGTIICMWPASDSELGARNY